MTTLQAVKQFLVVVSMAQQDQAVVFAHSVLLIPNVLVNSALQLVAMLLPKNIQPMSKSLTIRILHTASAFYPWELLLYLEIAPQAKKILVASLKLLILCNLLFFRLNLTFIH